MILHRILHVEDDSSIRAIAKVALVTIGNFELLSCASGQEALNKIEAFKPQLILLDVMMPTMDGPTTLVKIQQLIDITDIPILFMTAKVQVDEVERCQSIGEFGLIMKPFKPLTLAQEILQYWERFHGR